MSRFLLLGCAVCFAATPFAFAAPAVDAQAQSAPPVDCTSPATAAQALQPFVASYAVFDHGRSLGNATLQLVALGDNRWRVDLAMKGSGLLRLTGLNIEQSTVFDVVDGRYRPLAQATASRSFLRHRRSTGRYDWQARTAQWSGDVKPSRHAPIALQDGDMSALLIDLAVVRDAAPGASLRYRYVDGGRSNVQDYVVASQSEPIRAGDIDFAALRVERSNPGGEQTSVWVTPGVPTPIRILQREDGEDALDLHLVGYH